MGEGGTQKVFQSGGFSTQESKKKTYLKTLVEISHRTQSLINLNKVMH